MAQVAENTDLYNKIDHYLNYLLRKWASMAELAAEWPEWDDESRFTFAINWGVPKDRMAQLRQWAEQGLLTPAQCARYEELCSLVQEHGPLLERMLATVQRGEPDPLPAPAPPSHAPGEVESRHGDGL